MPLLIQSASLHSFTASRSTRRLCSSGYLFTVYNRQLMDTSPTDWHSGLCDCFEDASSCCYGFWCCPCLACTVSRRFGECTCLPLCDIFSLGVTAACGIPLFIPPPAVLSVRAAMRNRFNIKGSICNDIGISCFCVWCSWCQMYRELKHREEVPAIINVQNVINMQPIPTAPVMMVPGFQAQPGIVMM